MSEALQLRSAEVQAKLALLRECLNKAGAAAIRLRGIDWFAWVTAGGSSAVLQCAETGVAEVLVTQDEAVILTDEIELARLREEEIPAGFSFHASPWAQGELRERYVLGLAGDASVLSDRPHNGEQPLPHALRLRRLVLGEAEQMRYRALGREAAEAMSEVLRARST
ncbi:MAG TPA: peptidase M24, partial [Massilia sp.]|nr:peptidase M24 [Massilia sp.]